MAMELNKFGKMFAASWIIFGWCVLLSNSEALETEVNAFVGSTIALPCRVDTNQCGQLHSVKWYRETSRIYVYSQVGNIARAEGEAINRMTLEYSPTSVEALLKISKVHVEDEATYKCEITYLEVRENCDVVQIVKLLTLIRPESVRIHGNDGVALTNSSSFGPKDEGTDVEIVCESMGGKPIPKVSWYINGTTELKRATYTAIDDGSGIGTGRSQLKLTLTRGDLNARFECRVESKALEEPIVSWITADVNVRPTGMEVSGVRGHVVEGSNVLLICDVFDAKPASTIKWFNGSTPVSEKLIHISPEQNRNGTFNTKSSLEFKASRFENGKAFHCYSENQVMKNYKETALHNDLILEVQFPPVITVSPKNISTNESGHILLKCNYFANPQELQGIAWSKDGKNLTLTEKQQRQKYAGGSKENPNLIINNVTREDMGEYTCWLRNSVGADKSEDSIFVNVEYPPSVELSLDPSTPIKTVDNTSVTLACNVTNGNPSALTMVRWFLDGDLLKELPDCNNTLSNDDSNPEEGSGDSLCDVDLNIFTIPKVEKIFAGNYTCQGKNDAGWGPKSEPQELIVYYPPSPAKLRFYPQRVVKKASVSLECLVDDLGWPDNVTYLWYRSSHQLPDITTSNWTISPVTLETRTNFTCIAQNEGGQSLPGIVDIKVLAPPTFIQNLPPYLGILYSSKNINLTCRVECHPMCSIIWFKDGRQLDLNNDPLYYHQTAVYPADLRKNDFESIESIMIWNMTAWPNNQLDKSAANAHYTCQSYDNGVGPGVNSTVEVAVDFPPEEIKTSSHLVYVIEHHAPDPVKCFGKGRPALSYVWKKDEASEPLSKKDTLQLGTLTRKDGGKYTCEASNKHGTRTADVYFNVQYAPECSIQSVEREGSLALVCTATANPQEVTFTWKVRESNDTFIETANIIKEGLKSYLMLDSSVDSFRTYQCFANNSVGVSSACERDVAGHLPWWKRLNQDKLIIIIAATIAIILCVIVVCIIIIVLCRRKRANTKSPMNQSSTGDKNRLGAAPPIGGIADPLNEHDKGFYENLPFHGMQNPPNKNAFYTLTSPHYKEPSNLPSQYSTIPYQKPSKLVPRALFQEQLPKSKSFSSKAKNKKHFQMPLQKCHSFKFQTAESYFQPIKNLHEENLMKNGYVSDYTAEHHQRSHKRHKQKTKGPLVLRRPSDYEESRQFQEQMHNSVQLQYPQPSLSSNSLPSLKQNGVLQYADLDMPKNIKKSHHPANSKHKSHKQKHKPKTEYATLKFNDIGQEIDV